MIVALIPCYNASRTIADVLIRTKPHVDTVIIFDDGSTDNTRLIAEKFGAIILGEKDNHGKGYALKCLFESGVSLDPDVLVTLDADCQHSPEDIPRFVQYIKDGLADVVVGVRQNTPWFRKIGNMFLDKIIGGVDTQSGFRAYSRGAAKLVQVKTYGFAADGQILKDLLDSGAKILNIPINVQYDEDSHRKGVVAHFIDVFDYFFLKHPLFYLGGLGLTMFFLGLIGISDVADNWSRTQQLALGHLLISMTIMLLGVLSFFVGTIIHVVRSEKR